MITAVKIEKLKCSKDDKHLIFPPFSEIPSVQHRNGNKIKIVITKLKDLEENDTLIFSDLLYCT